MSGDVQPRKRKDKKKKKDDLGVEEPRGTAAVFGDGDVFMHSHHEHGTGGHWCAKIIFFSLLAVLVGLIGLIILENRGLTDLEANSIESPYSNVLEGWLEDAPDDDHHDEHTLELKHHDDDDDNDHGSHIEHDDDDDQSVEDHEQEDEDESVEEVEQSVEAERSVEDDDQEEDDADDDDEDDENDNDDENEADDDDNDTKDEDDNDDDENNAEDDEDQESEEATKNDDDDDDDDDNVKESEEEKDNDDEDEDQNEETDNEDDNDERSEENQDDDVDDDDLRNVDENDDENDDEQDSNEDDDDKNKDDSQEDDEDDEEHEQEEPEEVSDVEVEHIEREVTDDDVLSTEQTEDDKADDSQEVSKEASPVDVDEDDDVEFLEPDELDELPEVLPIPVPAGKPLTEFEETSSTEKPQDSLAEEEEYERQQEEIRKEKEQASQGLWLKLTVGGALLAATHAVLRRAAAAPQAEESRSREETPLTDRRMTLIAEETTPPASVLPKIVQEVAPVIEKEVLSKSVPVAGKPPPTPTPEPEPEEEIEEEEIEEEVAEEEEEIVPTAVPEQAAKKDVVDMELYSDEEELEEDKVNIVLKEVTPEPEEDDDVEIIDEEVIDEELGEDEEEEEISDVDDADLLNRLEAKYGRLPEPERFGRKDGGNSIEAEWPGEPNDPYWHDQLDRAERELREGAWDAAVTRASSPALRGSARARFVVARALDSQAEAKRDNNILGKAIAAYLELLKMNEHLSDKKLLEVTNRTLDRMEFKGNYLGAEPVYRLLIRRFPKEPLIRNKLTISFLKANRADKAEAVITETLKLFPDDKVALAHYGFILKVTHNKLEEAVAAFTKALEGDTGPACEPRFYYHLGDALMLLGRNEEAHKIHDRGAALGHFLSASQRSLYNVERLKSRPWWNIDDTPYREMAKKLEKSWKEILKEGQAAEKLFEQEKEGLREKGEWSQLDLFVRGREVPGRCARAPVTCSIAKFASCSRGQVKFSSMRAGTHVRAHVGPTNCRLRMHLGLSNTDNTYIRVDKEIRQWEVGKVLMFDDSFEHEVWHNGTGTRLVLIVDVWHPDLTPQEKRRLPPI